MNCGTKCKRNNDLDSLSPPGNEGIPWRTQLVRNRDPLVAARFQTAVDKALQRVLADPSSFPVEVAAIRWVLISRFPYRLMFEYLDETTILVLAVAHTSRRSRYWRRRS